MAGAGFIPPALIKKSVSNTLKNLPPPQQQQTIQNLVQQEGVNTAALGLGALGLAGSVGFTAGLEGASLGAVAINPFLAIPAGLAILATELISEFQGRPKMLDTIQAVIRLGASHDPEIQQLARNFAIYVKNGEPLSSSNPQVQAQIRQWIGGAISTIGERRPGGLTPAQVTGLDLAIRNVLNSHTAKSGAGIDNLIAQYGFNVGLSPQPTSPLKLMIPTRPPGFATRTRAQPTGVPAFQPPAATPTIPQQEGDIVSYLRDLASRHPYLQLTGCIALAASGQEGLAVGCLEELAIQQISQGARNILHTASRYISSLIHPQIFPGPGPLPSPQPFEIPTLDQHKPCPGCDSRSRVRDQIRHQEQQLQGEIHTEQDQEIEQQLAQQEQQITQFAELETQPAGTRNIPQELVQKAQIQQQLQEERRILETQTGTQPGGQPEPSIQPDQVKTLQQPAAQQQIESQIENLEHAHKVGVQFCVGCQSQEDAVLFLNGEPSACSVVPGSTKELHV